MERRTLKTTAPGQTTARHSIFEMISNPTETRRERGTRQKIHPLRSNVSFARVRVLFYPSRSREHLHPGLISTAHIVSSSPRFGNRGENVRKKIEPQRAQFNANVHPSARPAK